MYETDLVAEFTKHMIGMLERITETQRPKIEAVARLMSERICGDGNIFVFGPGHAGIITEDFFYRAGGLAVVNPLFNPCLSPSIRPITLSTASECMPGLATAVLEQSPIKKGDLLLIHSVAARNPVVVEMALLAKEKDIDLAAIINMDFATKVTSKDPSGKMLQDVVPEEYVIDNCGELGDACMSMEGMKQKIASTSSISGTFIVACIVLEVCRQLREKDVEPPIFSSSNVDGGAEINERLLQKYKKSIFYM